MKKYKIQIKYQTGDSFNTSEEEDFIEMEWEDLDIAKVNLVRIQKHYKMYQEINEWRGGNKLQDILKKYKNEKWFNLIEKLCNKKTNCAVDEKVVTKKNKHLFEYLPDTDAAEYYLNLVTDSGTVFTERAFWTGHFERLISGKIIIEQDNDMEFEIN